MDNILFQQEIKLLNNYLNMFLTSKTQFKGIKHRKIAQKLFQCYIPRQDLFLDFNGQLIKEISLQQKDFTIVAKILRNKQIRKINLNFQENFLENTVFQDVLDNVKFQQFQAEKIQLNLQRSGILIKNENKKVIREFYRQISKSESIREFEIDLSYNYFILRDQYHRVILDDLAEFLQNSKNIEVFKFIFRVEQWPIDEVLVKQLLKFLDKLQESNIKKLCVNISGNWLDESFWVQFSEKIFGKFKEVQVQTNSKGVCNYISIPRVLFIFQNSLKFFEDKQGCQVFLYFQKDCKEQLSIDFERKIVKLVFQVDFQQFNSYRLGDLNTLLYILSKSNVFIKKIWVNFKDQKIIDVKDLVYISEKLEQAICQNLDKLTIDITDCKVIRYPCQRIIQNVYKCLDKILGIFDKKDNEK